MTKPMDKIIKTTALGYVFMTVGISFDGIEIIGHWLGFLILSFALGDLTHYDESTKKLYLLAYIGLGLNIIKILLSIVSPASTIIGLCVVIATKLIFIKVHISITDSLHSILTEKGLPVGSLKSMQKVVAGFEVAKLILFVLIYFGTSSELLLRISLYTAIFSFAVLLVFTVNLYSLGKEIKNILTVK